MSSRGLKDDWDFIVVGGGSAGSVVASRLSENPKWKVLLLEAGGNPPIESEIPALLGSMQKTEFDWQFSGKSELASKANVNDTCRYAKGKMLGGTSSLNGMIYTRWGGKKEDYDHWAEMGNNGWDYDSVLPYFKKSEGNQYKPFVLYQNGKYHNGSGPMKIDFFGADGLDAKRKIFLDAAAERGHPIIEDINADKYLGYLNMQATYANGRRQSAATSFLNAAKDRKNLHVIKHAFVVKILIDDNNNAYGVKFTYKNKRKFKTTTRKEVIVSGGSFLSPHLLMNSGTGPKDHLQKLKIPVKADIPVGQNLADHQSVYIWFQFNPTETSPTAQLDSLYQYVVHGTGPLTSRGVTNVNGFINTANTTGPANIQVQVFYYTKNSDSLTSFASRYKDSIKQTLLKEALTHDLAAVIISNIHPKSRGVVELNHNSVHGKPIVDPLYFSNADDVEALLQAMKQQLSFENTTSSNSHHYGSSRMGPTSDPTSVVDPRLKVKNIGKLRQIDAGVIPSLVSGNTYVATMMIAEKGSDFIKSDYGFIP
ncbi:glucose dehydrogenase [FAD, quinone]-like [Sitodiplosis mosellana]|uniref:glucose dehydrogenase [FAD, quinone]-like n=1 Tax=Sitodiplosis mosellana TaxID=263140 RepID=UPI002444C75E|nr:glucose dehydrogenase [FAD, quinone]-like [Sitodiplosis mosellana]